jgi:hypothetical protein
VTGQWPLAWPAEWASAHPAGLAGIVTFDRNRLPSNVVVEEGEWAGVRRVTEGGSSGPTGMPWVDSNGWKIRLLSMKKPGHTIWIESKSPAPNEVIGVERYLTGIADAAAHGGKWVLKLDSQFAKALAAKDAGALDKWSRISAAIRFFERRAASDALPPRAVMAVISDFSGGNEYLSQEILNLAARQQLPHLLIDKERFTALPGGLKAVVYPDEQAPASALRAALLSFVRAGGVLITSKAWGQPDGTALAGSPTVRYTLYSVGKGRIAVAGEGEMSDPYLVAADTQVLLSHRHDLIRLWNGGSMGAYPTGNDKRSVVHLINYSGQPGADPVSFWIAGDFQSVTMHSFEYSEPKKLPVLRRRNGMEVHLPPIAVYAALEAGS